MLVEAGANVNSLNDYGNTPLHESKTAAEIAKVLLAGGADATMQYNAQQNGGTANDNKAMVDKLLVMEKLA